MRKKILVSLLTLIPWTANAAPVGWALETCTTGFYGPSFPQPTHTVELGSSGTITDVDWVYQYTRQGNGQTQIGAGSTGGVYDGMVFKKGENPVADNWKAWYKYNAYLIIVDLVGATSIWMGDDICETGYLFMGQYPVVI